MPVFVGNSTVNTAVANSTITVDQTQNFAYATSNRNSIRPSLNLDFTRSQTVDPRITFTRASSGTYFNSRGVLTTATTNVPRIDYNPITGACNGLLVEQASTNLITYSSNVATFGTTFSTITANAATSPDGTTTAALMIPSTDLNNNHFINNVWNASVGNSITFTVSIFAKSAGYQWIRMNTGNTMGGGYLFFDIINGVVGGYGGVSNPVIQACGNGWFRCSYQYTTPATGTGTIGHQVYGSPSNNNFSNWSGNGTSGYYFWGAQVEQLTFPTSYIATTAATATRSADVASIPIGTLFNPNAFTVYTENIMANITPIDYSRILVINNSSNPADGIRILTTPTSNPPVRLYVFIGSTGGFPESGNSVLLYTANAIVEGALSVSSNNAYITWNGATPVANNTAFGTYIPSSFTTLWISAPTSITGANTYCGWARRIVLWTQALSNTELQTLTS